MDPVVIIAVTGIFLVMILARVPIAFALAASGAIGLLWLSGWETTITALGSIPFSATAKYGLIIVATFVLMGTLTSRSGMATDIFAVAHRFAGRLRGGLAVTTICACTIFGGISGSSAADVAVMGRLATREMTKHGYPAAFSTGVVAASGTLAILIPPSVVLVFYGIITGESIGDLLLAGIIPGLLSAGAYIVYVVIRGNKPDRRAAAAGTPGSDQGVFTTRTAQADADWSSHNTNVAGRRQVVRGISAAGILFSVVIGGIYFGVLTATEAGSIGAFAALILAVIRIATSKGRVRKTLSDAFLEAVNITSMVFALIVGGAIFTNFLVVARLPMTVTAWVAQLSISPTLVVLLALLLMIPLGMFLDGLSILLITMPVLYPALMALGFDGIWFGVLAIKMIEIGLITPPVGINVFVAAGVSESVSVEAVFRAIVPFIVMDAIVVALLFSFPSLVTWLPSLSA